MDVLKNFYEYLTKAEVNNALTVSNPGTIWDMFLDKKNVHKVSRWLYLEGGSKGGFDDYCAAIANDMELWLYTQDTSKVQSWIGGVAWLIGSPDVYAIDRLNQNFVQSRQHANAEWGWGSEDFNPQNMINRSRDGAIYNVSPDNPYRDQFAITTTLADGSIVQSHKKGKDMMPADYQNWDVWRPQTTYADFDFEKFRSFRNFYGCAGTKISRHVDRDPESFGLTHRDPFRASLEDTPRAWDNREYLAAKGLR